MLVNIVIGCVLVVLTTIIHAVAMVAAVRGFKITHAERWARAYGPRARLGGPGAPTGD